MSTSLNFRVDPATLHDLARIEAAWLRLGLPKVSRAVLIRYAINRVALEFLDKFPDLATEEGVDPNQLRLFTEAP